jgi:DDE_Tnp_1-associated
MTANLIEHFAALEDPRIDRNIFHALIELIVVPVCAVASGAEGWEAIDQS